MAYFKSLFITYFSTFFSSVFSSQDKNLMMNGLLCASKVLESKIKNLTDAEFRVYSQFGEDGIILFLINNIPIKNKIFIEFGVENYLESNTRFLLKRSDWQGLVLDGSKENINYIRNDEIMWKHNITPLQAFIDKDNINNIISSYTTEADIGLLSIDIDGNDYWVWESINVIHPRVVVCEYNNLFGGDLSLTIPYNPTFSRSQSHYSNLYFGASISALVDLAIKKGYFYVGSNSAGNNAFFIRNDLMNQALLKLSNVAFFQSNIRESRDENGKLNYLNRIEQLECIKDMVLVDTKSNREDTILNLLLS